MRLLLIDGTGYLFRAFHAVGDMRTSKGIPTGAVYGLVSMLTKLREKQPAQLIVCVMDAAGKTFRHSISPDYKANRPPLNPDLRVQIEPAKQFVQALGWNLVCQSGVEADDVIATLALQGKKLGFDIIIASGDKDLMQLVDDNIHVYDGMREKVFDQQQVIDRFGVSPQQLGDYLALVGDSSDNIKGVNKVGAKTASKLLSEHQTLNNIINVANEDELLPNNKRQIKGVVGDNIRNAHKNGILNISRQLVTLKTDVELPFSANEAKPQTPNVKTWQSLCQQFEFRRLASIFDSSYQEARPADAEVILELTRLKEWTSRAQNAKSIALRVQTNGDNIMKTKIIGISLSLDGTRAAYIPIMHEHSLSININDAINELRPLLENDKIHKVFHNAKYELHALANAGATTCNAVQDIQIAAYSSSQDIPTTLLGLAEQYCNVALAPKREWAPKEQEFDKVKPDDAAKYVGGEVCAIHKVLPAVRKDMSDKARKIYDDIDLPLMPVLLEIERVGVKIDANALNSLSDDLKKRMNLLEKEAHDIAGGEFNLNSPRQLEALLFDKMGAPAGRKTMRGGARSTSDSVLQKLAADYPLARVAREWREAAKLFGTYSDKLPQMLNDETGRVHTDYNQTSVVTGRLSSTSPNLQNIPIRTAEGRLIRKAFVAEKEHMLISADYSQIELRLMAHLSGDQSLLKAFKEGADVHKRTAAEVFGLSESEVDDNRRRAAKAINFGLIYGMSSFGLARSLGLTNDEAAGYIRRYFERYKKVKTFMDDIRRQASEDGYVSTICGRRIPVHDGRHDAAMRAAINAPMQGSAADIIKMAMINIHYWLHKNKMKTRMILQVHDELVLESPLSEVDDIIKRLPRLMCGVVKLKVPLEISVGKAPHWDDAH